MSELVVIEYVSLDGVIQAPGHPEEDTEGSFRRGGWTAEFMAEHGRYMNEPFQAAAGFLFGRLTYDIWAQYWPTVTDEADDIARALNTRPKYVASKTLEQAGWPGTVVIRDVPGEVGRLKREPGGPIIVMGSSRLAQTLMEHRLIDQYQLWIHPVVLGGGKRLFGAQAPNLQLRLVDSRTTSGGLVMLTYAPA